MSEIEREQRSSYSIDLPKHPPTSITIDGPLPGGRWLARPLVVQVEEDDGEFLVSEPHFYIHASGPTVSEAIAEFKRVFSDELTALISDEEKLGPRLRAQLQYLRNAIRMA